MLESKQTLTEAGFAVAIKGARCLGQADLGRKFLADYGRARFRPKEALYASVSWGERGGSFGPGFRHFIHLLLFLCGSIGVVVASDC